VAEKDLDHADVGTALQQMGGKAVSKRVHRDVLGKPCRLPSRSTGGVKDLLIDRMRPVAAGEQPRMRARLTGTPMAPAWAVSSAA
jgi:hypothetical protein